MDVTQPKEKGKADHGALKRQLNKAAIQQNGKKPGTSTKVESNPTTEK